MITRNNKTNMEEKEGLVSVIFPTMNRKEDLTKCIDSIRKNTYKKVEIIILDNGSTDGTVEMIRKKYLDVILIESKLNLGVPVAYNECVKKSKGEFLFRLDDDVILGKTVIEEMVKTIKRDLKIGGVGCLYFYTERPTICRCAGMSLNFFTGKTKFYNRNKEYYGELDNKITERELIPGALLMRRKLYNEIGGFSEEYFLVYEDIDLAIRIKKAGYKLVVIGEKLYHSEMGGLSEKESFLRLYFASRSQVLLMKKNAGWRNIIFFPYLFLFLYPTKLLIFLFKGNLKAIKFITKGIYEGIFKEEVFVYDKKGNKVTWRNKK